MDGDLTLDGNGNAIGGLLLEIFGVEMTVATGSCQGCGRALPPLRRRRVAGGPQGSCHLVDLRGLRWLEVPRPS